MSTDREKAIEKIRKLLRLSTSSNEHEAAAAMRQARKMMREHKLDDNDVSDDVSATWRTIYQGSALHDDLAALITCVCRVFNTVTMLDSYVANDARKSRCIAVVFFGSGASAKLAVYAAQCMFRQMTRDRKLYQDTSWPFATPHQKRMLSEGFNIVWLSNAWTNLKDITPDEDRLKTALARREQQGGILPAPRKGSGDRYVSEQTERFASEAGKAFRISTPVEQDNSPRGIAHER